MPESSWWAATAAAYETATTWWVTHRWIIEKGEAVLSRQFGSAGVIAAYGLLAAAGVWLLYRVVKFVIGLLIFAVLPAAVAAWCIAYFSGLPFQPLFGLLAICAALVHVNR